MKTLAKRGFIALGAALHLLPSAHAQNPNANDLVIGFNGTTAVVAGGGPNPVSADFLYDLGNANTIIAAGANDNLSGDVSGSLPVYTAGLNVGAVGGANSGTIDAFMTTIRTGGGLYTSAGTEAAPQTLTGGLSGDKNAIATAGASVTGLSLGMNPYPSATTVGTANTSGNSWTQTISAGPAAAGSGSTSFVGRSSLDPSASLANESPMINFGGSSVVVEDLWGITASSTGHGPFSWTYEGDLTIDLSGSSPSVIFDLAPTPEPGTCALATIGGLLLLDPARPSMPAKTHNP